MWMEIKGLQKASLVDYPDRIVATIFLPGCSMRCPFCYNRDLVLIPNKIPNISEKDIIDHLENRRGKLDGVCITGGEPTLHKDLIKLCKKIKQKKFLVKIDTNGTNPEILQQLIKDKLVDYIAMDIKGNFENYKIASGIEVDMDNIRKSIKLIKSSGIDYEFRTTVVRGLHIPEDIEKMAKELAPAKKYVIQNFMPKDTTINPEFSNLTSFTEAELEDFRIAAKKNIENVEIRS